MNLLEKALDVAYRVHKGQKDKYGMPYLLHPIRVMQRVENETEQCAALLHDVVEDSPTTLDDLREEGFPERVVELVDLLSRREDESYAEYIARLEHDAGARRLKLADLEDNMDMRRVNDFGDRDKERMARYHTYWKRLKKRSRQEND